MGVDEDVKRLAERVDKVEVKAEKNKERGLRNEGRLEAVEKAIDNLPRNFERHVETAIQIAVFGIMDKMNAEYKENNKWKDRTIAGFIISLLLLFASAGISMLRGK